MIHVKSSQVSSDRLSSSTTASSILRDSMHGQAVEDLIVEHKFSTRPRWMGREEFGNGDGGGRSGEKKCLGDNQ